MPTYILIYLLNPWSRVLLKQPAGSQPLKKFLAFYGTPNLKPNLIFAPIPRQMHQVDALPLPFFRNNFNIILPPRYESPK